MPSFTVMISRFLAGIVFLVGVVASMADAAIFHGPVINPANGRAYYLLESDTWQGSAAQANALGGHLVVINDQAENEWVAATFGRFGGVARNLWLGMSDAAKEGTFAWMTREPLTFTAWRAGEPDNSQAGENYAFLSGAGEGAETSGGTWADTLSTGDGGQTSFHGVVEADHLENDDLFTWSTGRIGFLAADPWAIGWRTAEGQSTVLYDGMYSPYKFEDGLHVWRSNSPGVPTARLNSSAVPAGSAPLQPYEIVFEPGANGEFVEAVWEAPISGSYTVKASFTDIDATGDGQDVHVLVNGTEVFSSTIDAGTGVTRTSYVSPAPVSIDQGQRVIIRAGKGGPNSNAVGDATRIEASVHYANTAITFYSGNSNGLRLDSAGNLVVTVENSELTYNSAGNFLSKAPVAPPDSARQDYVQVAAGKVSKYRGVDAQLLWSTLLDPAFTSKGVGARILDVHGNVLIVGHYDPPVWDPNVNVQYCVEKYAGEDGRFLWRKTLGSLFKGSFQGLVTDSKGNALALGLSSYTMMHVWKISATDGQLLWGDSFFNSFAMQPSFRASGTLSLRCVFDDSDNPVIVGEVNRRYTMPEYDIYAAKYETNTGLKLWQKLWRAPSSNYVQGALVDRQGDVVLVQSGSFLRYKAPSIDGNKPPVARDDLASAAPHPSVTDIWCLANDSDPEGAILAISSFTQPANGDVVSISGGLRYAPKPGFSGEDQFTYVVSDGVLTAQATVRVSVFANLPVIAGDDAVQCDFGGALINVLANDSDPEGKPLAIAGFTQPHHGKVRNELGRLIYTPSPRFLGTDQFTYTVTDGITRSSAAVTVTVMARTGIENSLLSVLASGPDGWSGWVRSFRRLGIPSINDREDIAFLATFSNRSDGRGKVLSGVFVRRADPSGPFIDKIAYEGFRVPNASGLFLPKGVLFRSFRDPLLNARGDVAFRATLSKAPPEEDSGLWLKPAEGQLRMVAREGDPAAGVDGARFGTFISLGLTNDGAIPFVAKLQVGKGGVTSTNALGLWMYKEEGTQLLLRQGDKIQVGGVSKKVKLFAALTAAINSPGHGRLGAGQELLVRVTWNDKTQSLVRVSPSAAPQILVSTGDLALGTEARFARFGMPSPDKHGGFAVSATLQEGEGGVTSANDVCVYACTPEGAWQLLAREAGGELLDLDQSQPVRNAEGRTAFIVRNSETGTDEIWSAEDGLVYGGDEQPSSGPSRSIVSLALPDGEFGGAVYLARSERSGAKGKKATTSPMGLWAIDEAGEHHLLCEVGQRITLFSKQKTIRSIDALRAVPRSAAQPRSFNAKGQIVYRLTFTDGSQAIVHHQLP